MTDINNKSATLGQLKRVKEYEDKRINELKGGLLDLVNILSYTCDEYDVEWTVTLDAAGPIIIDRYEDGNDMKLKAALAEIAIPSKSTAISGTVQYGVYKPYSGSLRSIYSYVGIPENTAGYIKAQAYLKHGIWVQDVCSSKNKYYYENRISANLDYSKPEKYSDGFLYISWLSINMELPVGTKIHIWGVRYE